MKKTVLFILFCSFIVTGFAQKKTNFEKRAERSSNAIADQMDLTKDQKSLLYSSLLERQERNYSQLKDKELSQEERKEIFDESHKIMIEKLTAKFSKVEINRVTEILKKQQEKMRKA